MDTEIRAANIYLALEQFSFSYFISINFHFSSQKIRVQRQVPLQHVQQHHLIKSMNFHQDNLCCVAAFSWTILTNAQNAKKSLALSLLLLFARNTIYSLRKRATKTRCTIKRAERFWRKSIHGLFQHINSQ